jgi:hypothetical protein
MRYLTQESFSRAKAFVKDQARELDRRLFEHLFEDGKPEAVSGALSRYQNADGGFGQAIEPDFRLPASSPMATTIGLAVLRDLQASPGHPMVQKAIRYLLDTYDPARKGWISTPRQVNDFPHAPWWHFDEKNGKNGVESGANPGAEIVGYFHTWPELVPAGFLKEVTSAKLAYLETLPEKMEMHDLICFVRLAERLPNELLDPITGKLEKSLASVVARDAQAWASYGPQPLMYVSSPDSPFTGRIRSAVEANLDYLIDTQGADGSWSPNWSWGENYPEAWEQAKRDWQGQMTVDNLRKLQAFGRLSTSV